MYKETFKKSNDDYYLFLESGFVAVNHADEDSALKLFMACQILRPDNVFPQIGYGYMHLCKLELKLAEEMFEKVLKKDPKNEMATTFLGICKSMMPGKTSEGEKILEACGKNTSGDDVKELVARSQEFIEQYVKKGTSSPMDLAKENKKKSNT